MSVHILCVPTEIAHDEPDGERWCFRCRERREFRYIVRTPIDPMSYYGPLPSVRCSTCDGSDADLFPGRNREWEGL